MNNFVNSINAERIAYEESIFKSRLNKLLAETKTKQRENDDGTN